MRGFRKAPPVFVAEFDGCGGDRTLSLPLNSMRAGKAIRDVSMSFGIASSGYSLAHSLVSSSIPRPRRKYRLSFSRAVAISRRSARFIC
nr:hypothetical protein Itr_chr10CG01250 [Ipomoea trifida]